MPWRYTISANHYFPTQTSPRLRDPGTSFAARARGHNPHLSISDDAHHVTETIGYMYGDDEQDSRRAVAASPEQPNYGSTSPTTRTRIPRKTIVTIPDQERQRLPPPARTYSFERTNGAQSPGSPSRDSSPQETAQAHFPLNDIDYESSPAAVAQELSNLQALRRMSMDVHAAGDPDLPTLNPAAIPNSPSPAVSEDDSSRLFWVPARLHPELAPTEFKTFLDSKAEQIKRRSGELSAFSSPMSSRPSSLSSTASSLSRKKSMLSRQIDNSSDYQDGADRLERKKSLSHRTHPSDPNLAELETLVAANDPAQRPQSPDENGDIILPSVPGSSLKRSTRTKYNRGGPGTARTRGRRPTLSSDSRPGTASSTPEVPAIPSFMITSDSTSLADTLGFSPSSPSTSTSLNFSRPVRSPSPERDETTPKSSLDAKLPPTSSLDAEPPSNGSARPSPSSTFDAILGGEASDRFALPHNHATRTNHQQATVPNIVETPPYDEQPRASSATIPNNVSVPMRHPERTSSRETATKPAPSAPSPATPAARPPIPRTQSSSTVTQTAKNPRGGLPPMTQSKKSLEQPESLPGVDTNTSNLSVIPTLTVDKYAQDRKEAKKSGWSWGSLLGKDEKEEKAKGKNVKTSPHDSTRLDVLQSSIEGGSRRRETIEIDRDSLRLEEERKKESARKASPGEKKEKESIFSSIFGKKSKAEKESRQKSSRLSPEPPHRELRADIDYSWTRFSILEERAIYRMAHIKLANPRRPLHSQVLLSNFMYSYLAKVQQMHPQMNLPTSAKQQKKQKEQQQQQPEEFTQYQRYQQQQQQQQAQPVQYTQQGYDGESGDGYSQDQSSRPSTRGSGRADSGGGGGGGYYYQQQQANHQNSRTSTSNDDDDDMW